MDMDIYDPVVSGQTFSVSGAHESLIKCAGRIVMSMIWSLKHLPQSTYENLIGMLAAENLWAVGIVFAGWVIATIVGGPIALAVNGILLAYGLYSLYGQLATTWHSFRQWATTAYNATNDAELETAATHFADAVSSGGLILIELLVTHKVFKAVESGLRKRVPPPEWLETELGKAKAKAEAEHSSAAEKLARTAKAASEAVRGTGIATAGDALPVGAMVIGGIAAIATVTTIALLASGGSNGKR